MKHGTGENPKCKRIDMQCMLEFLYEHWDDPRFDAAKFVEEYINNQVEDWFYGRIGQQVGSASRDLGLSTGAGRPLGKALRDNLDGLDAEAPGAPIPQIHQDENGNWYVTVG